MARLPSNLRILGYAALSGVCALSAVILAASDRYGTGAVAFQVFLSVCWAAAATWVFINRKNE